MLQKHERGERELTTKNINLKIDGHEIVGQEGKTILQTATENGIEIPHLCFLDGLTNTGACRLCLVELKGSAKLFASCSTPISDGMEVTTNSQTLKNYRKNTLQLLLSERTHICSVCVANKSCELQELANKTGVDHVGFEREWTTEKIDSTHPFLVIDRNRCILCTRCIRVCQEIEGVHTLDLKLRGKDSQVIVDLDDSWAKSTSCTSCRKCAKVCPVGAIYIEGEPLAETKNRGIAKFVLSRRSK
jgi:bidirectional [NiFe] hydrogenase diaphorase subunit